MSDFSLNKAAEGMPTDLREAIYNVAVAIQCPLPLVLTSVLGVLSSACQASADVVTPWGARQPTSLFTLVLSDSGERKTAVDKLLSRAIHEHDARTTEAHEALHAKKLAGRDVHRLRIRAVHARILRAAAAGWEKDIELDAQLLEDLFAEAPRERDLISHPIVLSQATPTAILEALHGAFRNVTLTSSEGAAIFQRSGVDMLTQCSLLWDGEPIRYARKVGDIDIKEGRLTLNAMMQPALLKRILQRNDGIIRNSGLLARMLVTNPVSQQGSRMFQISQTGPDLTQFEQRLGYLLRLADTHTYHRQRAVIKFAPDAVFEVQQFANQVETELTAFGQLADVRDAAAKSVANACRIAALLHLWCHGLQGQEIDAQTTRVACHLATYYLTEFKRIFGERPIAEVALEKGQALYQWFAATQRATPGFWIRKSLIAQRGPNCVRRKCDLELALGHLQSIGVVHISATKPVVITYNGPGNVPFANSLLP